MISIYVALIAITALTGCADGGRFVGAQSCSADSSVVWWEYPNKAGNYDGLENSGDNCGPRG
jgi:hypothetical protein